MNAPRRFRKKPAVIEAMQYTEKNRDAVIGWLGEYVQHISVDDDGATYQLRGLRIHTLEGEMQADIGDYIIKGIKGEFYPCKPDIFAATYEAE